MTCLNRRSITGGAFLFNNSLVKAFSRIQQIVALSSCESELNAISETLQEGIGFSRLVTHFLDAEANVQAISSACQTCAKLQKLSLYLFGETIPVEIRTDSQAATRVLSSSGLQRRSRHVDLRVCWVQELVLNGRVYITRAEGAKQFADLLTKTLGTRLFEKHRLSLGFEVTPEHGIDPQSKEQNKHDQPSLNLKSMTTKVGRNKVFEPVERIAQEEPVASMLIDAGGLSQVKTNRFEEKFIEVCCDVNSTLSQAVSQAVPSGLLVIRITELAHYALPCSGGSNLVHLGGSEGRESEVQKFQNLLQECDKYHYQIANWSVELPRRNRYWNESYLQRFLTSRAMTLYAAHPKSCCTKNEIVRKTYQFVTTHSAQAAALQSRSGKDCKCTQVPFNQIQWNETGYYSKELAHVLAGSIKECFGTGAASSSDSNSKAGFLMWEPGASKLRFGNRLTESRLSEHS